MGEPELDQVHQERVPVLKKEVFQLTLYGAALGTRVGTAP